LEKKKKDDMVIGLVILEGNVLKNEIYIRVDEID